MSSHIRPLTEKKWNWKAQTTTVGMREQYELIYSCTSMLLHARPAGLFTDQKNLEASEMRLFLDYVYVSTLDALDLGESQLHLDVHQ